jgi:hypothetical protein
MFFKEKNPNLNFTCLCIRKKFAELNPYHLVEWHSGELVDADRISNRFYSM